MRKTIALFLYKILFNFIHHIFFLEAFYASANTIPLLYGAPSYKSGHHGKSVLNQLYSGSVVYKLTRAPATLGSRHSWFGALHNVYMVFLK